METVTLEVKSRSADNSARDIRSEGLIPAVFYGPKQRNKNLTVDYQTFRRIFEKGGGNTVLELDVDGKEKVNVLVHELQHDPITDRFTHIDFKFVDLNKEVTTEVPLKAIGESKAVREDGGTLMQSREMITVKCIAKSIPKDIEFDITPLEDFHSVLHISDLKLPEGVEVLDDPELTVASVVAPRAEEEEAPVEEEAVATEEEAKGGQAKPEEAKEEKAES